MIGEGEGKRVGCGARMVREIKRVLRALWGVVRGRCAWGYGGVTCCGNSRNWVCMGSLSGGHARGRFGGTGSERCAGRRREIYGERHVVAWIEYGGELRTRGLGKKSGQRVNKGVGPIAEVGAELIRVYL